MADGTVGVQQAASPDRLIDNELIGSVYRQRVRIGSDVLAALAAVLNSAPAGSEYALIVRNIPSGTQTVSGTVTVQDGGSTISIDDGAGSITVDGTVAVSGAVDTELPAAAALADDTANPTAPAVGAFLLAYDGTTWDRLRGEPTNGLDVDVTRVQGTVTVAGTVTADAGSGPFPVSDNGGSLTVDGTVALDAASLAALETISVANFPAAQPVTDNGGSLTVDGTVAVSGTVTVDSELPTAAALADGTANPTVPAVGTFVHGYNGTTWDRLKSVGDNADGAATSSNGGIRASALMKLYNGTTWDRARGDTTNGLDVDVTRLPKAATPAQSSVAGSASSVSLLAANANRLGATIYNDSSAVLKVKLGATASASSFTVALAALDANGIGGYYEVPYGYTGAIDGIWASATGSARITELT